ncbi:MAG: GNAT family N-acetyltransferase [Frankiaceae bacterium]|nr:GNAT family N-acetyltransferase [Frankiaceae bacterium]MBV9871250.1 GNAT family N-acetyltransferase [Frankiaceae bacterium]
MRVQEVGLADLDQIHALTSVCDIADSGEVDLTRDDVRAGLAADGSGAWALVDDAGTYQALVWIERNPARPSQSGEFFVRPGLDPQIAVPLIEQLLRAQATDPAGRKLQVFVNATAAEKSAVLRSHGAQVVRYFYKMAVELPGPTDPVEWSGDASARRVSDTDADLRQVHAVVTEAFQDHWEPAKTEYGEWVRHLRDRESFDPSLIWLVDVAGEPAAALIGAGSDGEGFVATLGVRRPYRGRGLGRDLLRTAFAEFTRRGLPRAALFVDSANPTGAVRLYESVGMSVLSQWDSHEFPAVTPAAQA